MKVKMMCLCGVNIRACFSSGCLIRPEAEQYEIINMQAYSNNVDAAVGLLAKTIEIHKPAQLSSKFAARPHLTSFVTFIFISNIRGRNLI